MTPAGHGQRLPEMPIPAGVSGLISIIVPVYNCEAYLEQCLQSILTQTCDSLEVLLVNDGSVDNSAAICDRAARSDPRVRVFHKTNGGVSSARNLALENARGEFLLFIDADDYVEPGFVAGMVKAIEQAEVAACAYDRVRADSAQSFVLGPTGPMGMQDLYEHTLCTQLIGGGCCNKIFRMAIIRELGLCFDTRIAVGEDMLFLVRYYQRCQRAGYVGEVLYHYRYNEVSATEAGFAERKVDQRTASILIAVEAMGQHVDASVDWQRQFLDYRKARSGLRLFFQMVLSRTGDAALLGAIQRIMRSSLKAYLRSRHTRTLEKLVAMAMAVSTRLTYSLAVMASGWLGPRLAAYRT